MEQGDWGVEEWLTEEEPVPEEASPRAAGATRDALVFANEVTARVVKVHLQDVRCDVLKIDGEQLFVPCRGTIRAADVMTLGIDRYDLLDCFRPGDLIRAKLVSRRRVRA